MLESNRDNRTASSLSSCGAQIIQQALYAIRNSIDSLFCGIHLVIAGDRDSDPQCFYLSLFIGGIWPLTFAWQKYWKWICVLFVVSILFFLLYWYDPISTFISNLKAHTEFEHDPFWPLLIIAFLIFSSGLILLPSPLLKIRITLLDIDGFLPHPLPDPAVNLGSGQSLENIAIRLINEPSRRCFRPLQQLWPMARTLTPWIFPYERNVTNPQQFRSREFPGDIRDSVSIWQQVLLCFSHFRRPRRAAHNACQQEGMAYVWSRWRCVKMYIDRILPAPCIAPLAHQPELSTLGFELAGIARFVLQQFLVPRDANRPLPLASETDEVDGIEHRTMWDRVARDLQVSLRLHSFQLFVYFFLLSGILISTAFDWRFWHRQPDCRTHNLAPLVISGIFVLWMIVSLYLRSRQVRALQEWAGRYKGRLRIDSPIFYHRPERRGDQAWEELRADDFDVEIRNFGLDHLRVIELAHGALLLIALDILEKLL